MSQNTCFFHFKAFYYNLVKINITMLPSSIYFSTEHAIFYLANHLNNNAHITEPQLKSTEFIY